MRRHLLLAFGLFLFSSGPSFAQLGSSSYLTQVTSAPTLGATCTVGTSAQQVTSTGAVYYCSGSTIGASGTWSQYSGSAYSSLSQDGTTGQITSSKSINGPAPSAGAFSATPTIDLATCNRCEMPALTANVTSVTFSHLKPGLRFSVIWPQAASGGPYTVAGYTVAGGSVTNTCNVSSTASVNTTQLYEVKSDGVTIAGMGCTSDGAGAEFAGTEEAAPGTPPTGGGVCWFDSTDHVYECKDNNSSTVYALVQKGAASAKSFTFVAAGCNNATAAPSFDLPTSGAPTATCFGTTTTQGALDFADAATSGGSVHFVLPAGWTGNTDINLVWFANAASSNAVRWSVATGCVADSAAISTGPTFNTASAANTAYTGTANQRKTTALTSVATTGCAAGNTMYVQVQRIGGDAGDTLTATAELLEMQVVIRTTPQA